MTKWEYKIVNHIPKSVWKPEKIEYGFLRSQMNSLGEDGWELVSVNPEQFKGSRYDVFFFKRPMN